MKVEQAVFGEVRSGHGLRLASDLSQIPAELASRLDLPDTAPPGVEWSPYLSGFPLVDRYVLARTFSDPDAPRDGMVLSHALIAPLNEITSVANVRPLLELLLSMPRMPKVLETCEVLPATEPLSKATDLLATAAALTSRGTGPVVRVGTQGFEELVSSLWFHFWPDLRAIFAFRLSFGPQDLVENPQPQLVCTPIVLSGRWTGFRTITNIAPSQMSRASAILSGEAEAESILEFARKVGVRLHQLSDLPLLERAYELEMLPTPKFDQCVAALRLLERLSPDATAGVAGKTQLLEKVTVRLPNAAARDILLLRNITADGLPEAQTLWAGIRSWASTNSFPEIEDRDILTAIDDSLSTSTAVESWRNAVREGIIAASLVDSTAFPAAFWRWVQAQPTTVEPLASHLSIDRGLETRLCNSIPLEINRVSGEVVMRIALMKRWWRLHGFAVGSSFDPDAAIRQQLAIDSDSFNLDGIKAALRRATPERRIAIALQLAEPRVLRVAGEDVALQPSLLSELDFSTIPPQAIWSHALASNPDAWRGPIDPYRSFSTVIQNLLNGGSAETDLIAALAKSPLSDLDFFSRRAEVWVMVEGATRADLLEATATGWLDRASLGHPTYRPDKTLESTILSGNRLDLTLRGLASSAVGTCLVIISALPNYQETRFLGWLQDFSKEPGSLAPIDAEALGRLILDRGWQRAVDHLISLARKRREDVKPSLRLCHEMVGAFTRWSLGLASISVEEKWEILEALAAELYPSGPDHEGLWDRAGGKDADLKSSGSGRDRWHDAMGQVRRGKKPRAAKVLSEMKRDFPLNDQVRYLASNLDFAHDAK